MLKLLEVRDVGPAPEMRLEFGERLNLLTGDNGLGKSFVLDIAWWALTRNWVGRAAQPQDGDGKTPSIAFSFDSVSRDHSYVSIFDRFDQRWSGRPGRPANPGLVLYARVDGGFSVWDPARNYWRNREGAETPDRPPAYHFTPADIWNGLNIDGKVVCNGLVRDWVSWQETSSAEFAQLSRVLQKLSPSTEEQLLPGRPVKVDLDDARRVPTIAMPYGQEVPLTYISAGMKRIIALAYLLVWAWSEHLSAANFLRVDSASQIIFLVDEIESHLHPRWQRVILSAILDVVNDLGVSGDAGVQMVASTHSPLVLTSVEPLFDSRRDAWFDIDIVGDAGGRHVELRKKDFVRQGDAAGWLTSEAFGLGSSRSKEAEELIEKASHEIADGVTVEKLERIGQQLQSILPDNDPFWRRWQALYDSLVP
jgi:hypothetical protein